MMHAFDFTKTTNEALLKHGILEDVIQEADFKPWGVLAGEFSSDSPIAMGNTLSAKDTQSRPTVQFNLNPEEGAPRVSDKDLFTLVITDPDAPSRSDHKWSEFCHYIEADIKILDQTATATSGKVSEPQFVCSKLNSGTELVSYHGPAPPKGTGKHRYVLLLYKQPAGVVSSKFTEVKDRPNWGYGTPATGVKKWASENNLKPIAANFFLVENK